MFGSTRSIAARTLAKVSCTRSSAKAGSLTRAATIRRTIGSSSVTSRCCGAPVPASCSAGVLAARSALT